MRKILIIVLLLAYVVGNVDAGQIDEPPPVYLYLHAEYGSSSFEDDLIPDWTDGLLLEVQTHLIEAGQNPIFVADDPTVWQDTVSVHVDDASNYDDIFEEPPFRAIYIRVQRWLDFDTFAISPYAPFPYEPLPMAVFGWFVVVAVQEDYPQYAADMTVGTTLYILNACDEAIPYLQHIRETADFQLDDQFTFSAPRFYEANCRYTRGEAYPAIKLFQEILVQEDADGTRYSFADSRWQSDMAAINLAAIYIEVGQTAEALDLLDAYQNMDAASVNVAEREFARYLARADLYLALNESDKAITAINEVLDYGLGEGGFQSLSLAWLYTERGYRYQLIGDESAALADYETAIATNPVYPVAYYRRGVLTSGEEGRPDLEQFLDMAPKFDSLHHPSLAPLIEDAESRLE